MGLDQKQAGSARPTCRWGPWPALTVLAWVLAAGCTSPIGADRSTTAQVYSQLEANALSTGKPSSDTVSILHRFNWHQLARNHPDEVVRRLHEQALHTGERDLLLALAEMSYLAAEQIRHSVKPWDSRDARDFYLGSAFYAWLYLFGDSSEPQPGPYARRFRDACDYYNYSLGLAFLEGRNTNNIVRIEGGSRRLPVGEMRLTMKDCPMYSRLKEFNRIVLADRFRIHGLSVRNRQAGLGAALICVGEVDTEFNLSPCSPATAFLRLPFSLASLSADKAVEGSLELYSPFTDSATPVGQSTVPLESDVTVCRAYTLNQSLIWSLGRLNFLAPDKHVRGRLLLSQPYLRGRIPVVFVHGTFSSPVTWAEMASSLEADNTLRCHYQFWSFIYSSSNPLLISASQLRDALSGMVQQLDPDGTDPALRNMVIIGHSQGGLLTKLTAIDTGERLWSLVNNGSRGESRLSENQQEELRRLLVLEPLPFVRRVVFISTPHRGSYQAGSFARSLAHRLVSLPETILSSKEEAALLRGSTVGEFLSGKMPTSVDGMSPKNPALPILAAIPVLPPIKAHSIISIKGNGDYHQGRDGLVAYTSAFQDYVESECIVRSFHTCLGEPATIQEVRRLLREHLITSN